jgi:hypothetical protein
MPRAPRGSSTPRQRKAEARPPRDSDGPSPREAATRLAEAPSPPRRSSGTKDAVVPQPSGVAEPVPLAAHEPEPEGRQAPGTPRFRVFIIDPGWDSPAHRVLQENFGLIRKLQKDDPIYVLGRDKSIEFLRQHQSRIGREPIIAVHDMAEMGSKGHTPDPDFHGFRLNLGLLHTRVKALMALQNFVRFLTTHRQSVDLEAEIRRNLRREGLAGAIEIVLAHEAREIGG